MLKIKVNKDKIFEFKQEKKNDYLNNKLYEADMLPISKTMYHLVKDNKSFRITVVEKDLERNKITLNINNKIFEVEIEDANAQLLEHLGFSKTSISTQKEVKSPMPGLVIDILVKPGQEVSSGTPLLILEAMKMENIIKSTRDGVINYISVEKGATVEKNQVLIKFQ